MAVQFPNIYNVEITKGPAVKQLSPMFYADKAANRIGANLFQNGQPYSPGGSCAGTAVLSDNTTVALTGVINGNQAYVDLTQACYSVPGPIRVFVSCVGGTSSITTVVAGFGNVTLTETGTIIDPGTIIPSVSALIADIDAAVESIPQDYSTLSNNVDTLSDNVDALTQRVDDAQELAANAMQGIASVFAPTAAYSAGNHVWYRGVLYRFTTDHAAGDWTGTDAEEVKIGAEVADLKSATESIDELHGLLKTMGGTGENVLPLSKLNSTENVTYVVDNTNNSITVTNTSTGTYNCIQTANTFAGSNLVAGKKYMLHVKSEVVSGTPDIRVGVRGTSSGASNMAVIMNLNTDHEGYLEFTADSYMKRITFFVAFGSSTNGAVIKFSDVWLREWACESNALDEIRDDVDAAITSIETVPGRITEVVGEERPGNLINPASVVNSSNYTNNIVIDPPNDGEYYPNPFVASGMPKLYISFLDGSNQKITLTNTGTQSTETEIETSGALWKFLVDGTTVKTYSYQYADYYAIGKATRTEYTLASTPVKWNVRGRWWPDVYRGITAYPSESYIPYGEQTVYSIGAGVTACIDNLPVKKIRQIEATYNLLDNTKLIWTNDSVVPMEAGYYIPVTAGDVISSTHNIKYLYTYDSEKVLMQDGFSRGAYNPYTIPEGCAYIRITFNRGSKYYHEVTENGELISVYNPDARGKDDFRPPIPYKLLEGVDVSTTLFKTPNVPSSTDNLMNYLRYQMVREINQRDNAFRIGNFNIFVSRQFSHWETIRRELMEHSLDIVGFEEVRYGASSVERRLPSFLKSWQFPYGSNHTPIVSMSNDRALVSHWEVLSTTNTVFPSNEDNSYLHCVIQLPHMMDYRDGVSTSPVEFTLSVYVYHGTSSKGEATRLAEIGDMLDDIASDTSDFVVVVGDVNAFNPDSQGKRPEWEAWKAGGFTPVIDKGNINTVHGAHSDICPYDNIFYGSNITCKSFNIIRSDDYKFPNSTTSEVSVSDHDLIYADLAFDIQAAFEARLAGSAES